jgi:hypothetical protein
MKIDEKLRMREIGKKGKGSEGLLSPGKLMIAALYYLQIFR